MKVQSRTDELNPLRAVSSGSDLARSSNDAELHFFSPNNLFLTLTSIHHKTNHLLFYHKEYLKQPDNEKF